MHPQKRMSLWRIPIMGKNRSAFSLVELLVAMGVVAVLAVLGITGIQNLSEDAKASQCLNNLRQIGLASLTCSAENGGLLPQPTHYYDSSKWWTRILVKEYGLTGKSFLSPFDRTSRSQSYAINDFITVNPPGAPGADFSRLQNVPMPSETLYAGVLNAYQGNSDHFHFGEYGYDAGSFQGEVWVELYRHAGNYLFVDGHVESLTWSAVKTELAHSGSKFVRPDGLNP
jgi:prepilin-type N-terminal cleavage/methylation domain-containing protein/prepilin-type processing-associated H-X9-DG protein